LDSCLPGIAGWTVEPGGRLGGGEEVMGIEIEILKTVWSLLLEYPPFAAVLLTSVCLFSFYTSLTSRKVLFLSGSLF